MSSYRDQYKSFVRNIDSYNDLRGGRAKRKNGQLVYPAEFNLNDFPDLTALHEEEREQREAA